ncbi:alpha/beta fold hydrolase [Virgibacillus flavescens]|uniref:alpha/beta fold hydrolase n=1 Tax=Virgibacillus flavescens TaxID=1611422 RepID=UPI003D3469E9
MSIITSDGIELFVEKSGKGIPCIYLHGGPGYWSKSFSIYSKDLLENDLEMIYLDQRGCGRSSHDPEGNYSLDRLVEDIEEVRVKFGIKEWYIMGHSFGGLLAVNYASKYSDRTKGIILVNATLNMMESFTHQINKGFEILDKGKAEIPTNNLSAFIEIFYSTLGELQGIKEYERFQFVDLSNKKSLDELDNDKEFNTDSSFQKKILSTKEFFQDFTVLSETINSPVLTMTGEKDGAVGPEHYQSFKFRNNTVSKLNGAHHPYLENPNEFKQSILSFINRGGT